MAAPIGVAAASLAYVVARAAMVPFTYDESHSYFHYVGAPLRTIVFFRGDVDANNHTLNSLLMTLAARCVGRSELALRLPNVAAFAGFAAAALVLIRRLRHAASRLLGAVLLLLNPFVLELFSLARGDGIALAFVLGSLAALTAAIELGPGQERPALRRLSLSAALACGSVLGNLAFLDFLIPLLGVVVVARIRLLRHAPAPS